ncbi:hypothetical protein FACS189434_02800 [Bacteroidia bacterium]|nr:hypothetical protein FACS189434_02800 [Bacteroidia bacterium]
MSMMAYSGGTGTEENPYLISSKADLLELKTNIEDGITTEGVHFLLTEDITGIITPICGLFSGTFDGGGHIMDVNMNVTNINAGIFQKLQNATIKNLGVTGNINATRTTNSVQIDVGSICGIMENSTITNCFNTADITYTSSIIQSAVGSLGGICGEMRITTSKFNLIENCFNKGTINIINVPTSHIGGICGYITLFDCMIKNCYNTGNIYGNTVSSYFVYSCGIAAGVGFMTSNAGEIKNCFAANTEIEKQGFRIGGRTAITTNCYALASMWVNGNRISSTEVTSENGRDTEKNYFRDQEWVEDNLRWDFNAVWTMSDINSEFEGFPILKWQETREIENAVKNTTVEKEVQRIEYFGIDGKLAPQGISGVFIKKITYTDNTTEIKKIIQIK